MLAIYLLAANFSFCNFVQNVGIHLLNVIPLELSFDPLQEFSVIANIS